MNEDETTPIRAEDIEAWRAHIGRQEIRRQRLDIDSLRRFAAAIGADLDVERQTPPLAHWAYFLEAVGPEGIGADGHPHRGGLLPAVRLPRRMFAAAVMTFAAPLLLDVDAELAMTVADVRHRSGKAGDLVFVEVDRVLSQDGAVRLSERQTIAYRGQGAATAVVSASPQPERPGQVIWSPGPVELFRYSAVTFNAHRIHYDLPYATLEEGYPGLVVQGPFTAAKLFALAQAGSPEAIERFEFRATAPLFAGQPVCLAPGLDGDLMAIRCDGVTAMTARAGG